MENEKTLAEQELEILGMIDLVLNSRRRWAAIERLLGHYEARLTEVRAARAAQETIVAFDNSTNNAVGQAGRSLADSSGLLVARLSLHPSLWRVMTPHGEVDLVLDDEGLLELARQSVRDASTPPRDEYAAAAAQPGLIFDEGRDSESPRQNPNPQIESSNLLVCRPVQETFTSRSDGAGGEA